jgi:hypothetical protein
VVDRRGVDSALDEVLVALRTGNSVTQGATFAKAVSVLSRASTDFVTAGGDFSAASTGIPVTVVTPVVTRMKQLGVLFHSAANCLTKQSRAKNPDPRRCQSPLRQANAGDAQLAHELISLAAYSSQSPKTFESQLVKALHGTGL